MITQEEIKSEMLSQELMSRNIDNHFSVSKTDYGVSCYFTFYNNNDKMVIRISDHSVKNLHRMENEVHRNAKTIDIVKTSNEVERFLFPERFLFVAKSKDFTHRINGVFGIFERI